MIDQSWRYPERQPEFSEAGEFTAWVAGSGSRQGSASAWRVEKKNDAGQSVEHVEPSRAKSTPNRAQLAAAAGALETLPLGSSLHLYTCDEYVSNTINIDMTEWSGNGWKKSDGHEPANLDIVRRLYEVTQKRQLKVVAEYVPKDRKNDRINLDRLQALAKKTRLGGN